MLAELAHADAQLEQGMLPTTDSGRTTRTSIATILLELEEPLHGDVIDACLLYAHNSVTARLLGFLTRSIELTQASTPVEIRGRAAACESYTKSRI